LRISPVMKSALGGGYREKVIALRKQNLSIYDINEALASEGKRL